LICNPAYEEIFVDGPREVGVVERTGRTVMLPDVYFDCDEDVREITKRRSRRSTDASTSPRRWPMRACGTDLV
jgi:hypothetical protein